MQILGLYSDELCTSSLDNKFESVGGKKEMRGLMTFRGHIYPSENSQKYRESQGPEKVKPAIISPSFVGRLVHVKPGSKDATPMRPLLSNPRRQLNLNRVERCEES